MKKYYVYMFKNNLGEIIYIGQTKDLDIRMKEHFIGDGYLKDDIYTDVCCIEYIILDSPVLMNIAEIHYINLYKPKYNIKYKHPVEYDGKAFDDSGFKIHYYNLWYIVKQNTWHILKK